jgi:hypothetical protein
MKAELVVNPSEFGIEEKQASELIGNLPQLKEERSVLEHQYNEVIKLDIEDIETSKKARELRLKIRDNRTKGIQQWHKVTKDYFLKGGQFVDAIKRMEVEVNQRMEDNLEQIEKHAEIKEQQRKEGLKQLRIAELELYAEFVPLGVDLGELNADEYAKVFNGAKLQYDAKIEAERKAEEERIKEQQRQELINANRNALLPWSQFIEGFSEIDFEVANVELLIQEAKTKKEEAEKEAERVRLENEKLKKEAEEKERKRLAEEKARLEKERIEREKQDAILKAEREAKAKLEAELQAKRDAEVNAERERIEAEKQAKLEAERKAKAPIKEKMTDWVNSFEIGSSPIENEVTAEIQAKFTAFKKWAQTQINNI